MQNLLETDPQQPSSTGTSITTILKIKKQIQRENDFSRVTRQTDFSQVVHEVCLPRGSRLFTPALYCRPRQPMLTELRGLNDLSVQKHRAQCPPCIKRSAILSHCYLPWGSGLLASLIRGLCHPVSKSGISHSGLEHLHNSPWSRLPDVSHGRLLSPWPSSLATDAPHPPELSH